jgi:hypothetical protein
VYRNDNRQRAPLAVMTMWFEVDPQHDTDTFSPGIVRLSLPDQKSGGSQQAALSYEEFFLVMRAPHLDCGGLEAMPECDRRGLLLELRECVRSELKEIYPEL